MVRFVVCTNTFIFSTTNMHQDAFPPAYTMPALEQTHLTDEQSKMSTNGSINGLTHDFTNGSTNGPINGAHGNGEQEHPLFVHDRLKKQPVSHSRPSRISERCLNSPRPIKLIYIGAGISGIIGAIEFMKKVPHLDLIIYEKNPEIGGTWYENR